MFLDVECESCGRKFGWSGQITDRLPCPTCGHVVATSDLEHDARELDRFQDFLAGRAARKAQRAAGQKPDSMTVSDRAYILGQKNPLETDVSDLN